MEEPKTKQEKNPVVKEMEEKYPEMTKEFKKILTEEYELFCLKQSNYGPSNIAVGTKLETPDEVKLSLTGIWFRMNDKIQRIKQLVVMGGKDNVGESTDDTYNDLSVYSVIALIVKRGKWGK